MASLSLTRIRKEMVLFFSLLPCAGKSEDALNEFETAIKMAHYRNL